MAKYNTKDRVIDAVRFDLTVFKEKTWKPEEAKYYACVIPDEHGHGFSMSTISGMVRINPGDYIVKMPKGWAPWDKGFFEKWFEPVGRK